MMKLKISFLCCQKFQITRIIPKAILKVVFQKTKKIKHPSGTTIIRVSDYNALKKLKQEEFTKNKNLKTINYKAPPKTINKRILEPKKPWTY